MFDYVRILQEVKRRNNFKNLNNFLYKLMNLLKA